MSDHSPKTTVKTVFKRINTGLGPFLVVIGISLFFAITTRAFLTVSNFLSLGHSASLYVLMAMGLSCVLISGGTDLSAGSVVGLCGVICALMMRDYNIPVIPSIVIALLCGTLCGLINGTLVTRLGLVPFIATLGTQWVYRGACNLLGSGSAVSVREAANPAYADQFYKLGGGRLFGVPVPIYIFILCGIILTFLLKKTVFGRDLYATGSNAEAARLSGINIVKTRLIAYMICDTMAALAGIVLAARLVSGQTSSGMNYEFEGIFAAVIGGVSLSGGEGTILGAVIGAFVVAILRNGMNLNGVSSFWQQVILGVLIIAAVYIDARRVRMQRQKKVAS